MVRSRGRRSPGYVIRARRPRRRWALPLLAALAAAVAAAVLLAPGRAASPSEVRAPVTAAILRQVTQIPEATWDAAGARDATPPAWVRGTTAAGRPAVLFVSAETCQLCAAERWPLIAALARFGAFQGLQSTRLAPGGKDAKGTQPPLTFTFYGATYVSPYIHLQARETTGTIRARSGGYRPLQPLGPAQQALLARDDAPPYFAGSGSIPFLLVGAHYAWQGTAVSPQLLQGSEAAIAASLPAGRGAAAQAILRNGNEIAAAICAADGGQPTEVCSSSGVATAGTFLPIAPSP